MDLPPESFRDFEESRSAFQERDERHMSLFRVGALTVSGRRELCLIRNVSAGGMQIRLYSNVEIGARISVEFKQGDPIDGTVQWIKDSSAGVKFDLPVDVKTLLAAPNEGRTPRMPRIGISCMVLIRDGANLARAQALDISQGGIRVECLARLTAGANVVVSIGGLEPEGAVVRWCNGNRYGLAFNRVLPVSKLVQWLHDQRPAASAASARRPSGPFSATA